MLLIKATIEETWHIYSIHQKNGGPSKTEFTFNPSLDYELIGDIHEPTPITKYDKIFQINVSYFRRSAVFQQKIKLKVGKTTVKGKLTFMVCNDQKCLPPDDVDFAIPIK